MIDYGTTHGTTRAPAEVVITAVLRYVIVTDNDRTFLILRFTTKNPSWKKNLELCLQQTWSSSDKKKLTQFYLLCTNFTIRNSR